MIKMDNINCEEKEEVINSNEQVSCDEKKVTLEESVETIVHIIMDLAAQKRKEVPKSSSSDFADKLSIKKEDSLELTEKGEVMEEVSKEIIKFDEEKTGDDDRYSWESESVKDDDDDKKTTKCTDIFRYLFIKLPSVIFSCWKKK
ncbi:uncharacterized protein LOC111641996 [Centruroides sculpturatus]|uniref:uncharacterized protein LOC111641996 n=1 Tax=Centruroides sculpturatus TaxID=218467 RepID=UPI000C6DA209|nr:uncharacterized protein LOC111641996 [Centruroides sculpturatus]